MFVRPYPVKVFANLVSLYSEQTLQKKLQTNSRFSAAKLEQAIYNVFLFE